MSRCPQADGVPQLYLTAEQAFPAFEEAILAARDRVVCGFRIFDPMTKLRSEAGREIGEDWFDLILHLLSKGVRVSLVLSDFDPVAAADMHRLTWSSLRKFAAIHELAGPEAPLRVVPAMHPARIGLIARMGLWGPAQRELGAQRRALNEMPVEERRAAFRDMPGLWRWLRLDGTGRARRRSLAPPHLAPATHHQKLAVIDGELLYVGGLDLNPRRYDTPEHRRAARTTWYDAQIMVRGEAAAAAERHLERLGEVTNGRIPPALAGGGFCTTMSARRDRAVTSFSPRSVSTGIEETTRREIAGARHQLYFETQFFRDRRLAACLAEAARTTPDLELVMVLPGAPEDVAFETRRKIDVRYGEHLQAECVETVRAAFGARCFFAAPAQTRWVPSAHPQGRDRLGGAPLVYVHAKLSVFDQRLAMVTSANLNGRSLRWDTEAGLASDATGFARDVLSRCLSHWAPESRFDLDRPLVPQVRERAERDAVRQPENRSGLLLPYDVTPARRLGRALPGMPDEMV